MRVAVVVRSLKIGGMERSAINIAQSFAKEGHESHLIYFRSKNARLKPDESVYLHHFDIERFMRFSIVGLVWMIFAKFLNMIIRHSYFFWYGIFSSLIFKYKIAKLEKQYGRFDLIILRGQGTFETLWMIKDERYRQVSVSMFIFSGTPRKNFFLRRLFDKKHIVCISSGVKEKIEEASIIAGFKPKSISIIHNPMDVESLCKKALEYTPDIDGDYIVYFGRITPNKNLSLGVEAFEYATRHLGLNMKFVIIGNGSKFEDIKNQVTKLGLDDSVIMLGALANPYPWVKEAKAFLFTSKAEGLGNVLLESLACHTPIVSVKTEGGARDIMRDELESFRVDFDKKKLAHKLMEVLENKPHIDYDKYLQKFLPPYVVGQYMKEING